MAMPAIRRRWTTEQVRSLMEESRAWPRYELIAGELLVTPAPGWGHQLAVMELAFLLETYLRQEPVGMVVVSPADLELRPGTITQPDVFVVPPDITPRGERLEWSDIRALILAIEVLSPGSARTDRVEKRDFYMGAGVEDYWIVDLDARVVERWSPARETPLVLRESVEWSVAGAA
jgi:Uma2 family endonuclease